MDSFLHHHLKLAVPVLVIGFFLFAGIALYNSFDDLQYGTVHNNTITARIGDGVDMISQYAAIPSGVLPSFASIGATLLVVALLATGVLIADAGRLFSLASGGMGDFIRSTDLIGARLRRLIGFSPVHVWGTVRDAATGEPVSLAQVCVRDIHGNCMAHTVSDISGRYGFLPPLQAMLQQAGIAKLTVQKGGYYFPAKQDHNHGSTPCYHGGSLAAITKSDTPMLDIALDRSHRKQRISSFQWLEHVAYGALLAGIFAVPAAFILTPSLATGVLASTFCGSVILRAALAHRPVENQDSPI